jgi:hypothetical protein
LEGSKCGYGGQLPKDDFGYGLTPNPEEAFSLSNRAGGQGYDDIYKFLETTSLRTRTIWKSDRFSHFRFF